MTDAEWAGLEPALTAGHRAGRKPANLRATWDAIFWIACTRLPWHKLPSHLGKPDSAQRALRRAAQGGVVGRLLVAVSDHPGGGGLAALRWRICRAARRVARIAPLVQTLLAERLGLADALPCAPRHLPMPHLSESISACVPLLRILDRLPSLIPLLRTLHRMMEGNLRAWRCKG
jgi:transposase